MRDINRIDKFCKEFAKIWKDNGPHQRFGQFISNIMGYVVRDHGDIWFPEEAEMIKYIREAAEMMSCKLPDPKAKSNEEILEEYEKTMYELEEGEE